MPTLTATPLPTLRVSSHQIPAYKLIPNTSIAHKPLLIYHNAFPSASASAIESHFKTTGVVTPQWRYTMYATSHFHSTSHEVLAVCAGAAVLCFGHEGNEGRVEMRVGKGDVVVVPAGVAHRLLEEVEGEGEAFEMVGAYPRGCGWDMCYGREGEEGKVEGIKGLGWFERDPVYGDEGPVLDV